MGGKWYNFGMAQGFKSEADRQAFLMRAGIWGVVFFIGQVIVPMIIMMCLMVPMMLGTMAIGIQVFRLDDAQPSGDGLLIVKRHEGMRGNGPQSLMHIGPRGAQELFATPEETWLAGDGTDVWFFTRSVTRQLQDGAWREISNAVPFCSIAAVAARHGALFVKHSSPDGTTNALVLRDGARKP